MTVVARKKTLVEIGNVVWALVEWKPFAFYHSQQRSWYPRYACMWIHPMVNPDTMIESSPTHAMFSGDSDGISSCHQSSRPINQFIRSNVPALRKAGVGANPMVETARRRVNSKARIMVETGISNSRVVMLVMARAPSWHRSFALLSKKHF